MGEALVKALTKKAQEGVKVMVMCDFIADLSTPNKPCIRGTVTTYYAGQIMEFGAKVYKYHGYTHAKTMTIDDELCCIVSVDMDIRSLMVDDEVCGIFYANDLVRSISISLRTTYRTAIPICISSSSAEAERKDPWRASSCPLPR